VAELRANGFRGFARPQGRARIETSLAVDGQIEGQGFARPQGRARIETPSPWILPPASRPLRPASRPGAD